MKCALLLSFLSLAAFAFAQTPPTIPESFLSHIKFTYNITKANWTGVGEGFWARGEDENAEEQELQMKLQYMNQMIVNVNTNNVSRYDLNPPMSYSVLVVDGKTKPCVKAPLPTNKLPPIWTWVKDATNIGTATIEGHTVEMWNATFNGITAAVGVEKKEDMEVPYYVYYNMFGNVTELIFEEFRLEKPHDTHSYKIPEGCDNSAMATTREEEGLVPSVFLSIFKLLEHVQFVF